MLKKYIILDIIFNTYGDVAQLVEQCVRNA